MLAVCVLFDFEFRLTPSDPWVKSEPLDCILKSLPDAVNLQICMLASAGNFLPNATSDWVSGLSFYSCLSGCCKKKCHDDHLYWSLWSENLNWTAVKPKDLSRFILTDYAADNRRDLYHVHVRHMHGKAYLKAWETNIPEVFGTESEAAVKTNLKQVEYQRIVLLL